MVANRSFAGGYFLLTIENQEMGIIQSVEGAGMKADLVTQPTGGNNIRTKSVGNLQIEPISFQVGAAISESLYDWIAKSWARQVERRNGSIVLFDFDLKPVHELEFQQALITETSIPGADAGNKGPLWITVKIQPEHATHKMNPGGGGTQAPIPHLQKAFQLCNYKFTLDGVELGRVNKIEAFTIKQNVKPLPVGNQRIYQVEPTSLEYPNLTLTTSLVDAGPLIDWHKKFVVDGTATVDDELTGTLSYLDPSLQEELLDVGISGVGITGLSIEKSDMSRNAVKRIKAELYVTQYTLDYSP